jgi:integral membrane sensor domain MASE1
MSLGVFQCKISYGNEGRKIWIFAALTFISHIFQYEILNAKYVIKLFLNCQLLISKIRSLYGRLPWDFFFLNNYVSEP